MRRFSGARGNLAILAALFFVAGFLILLVPILFRNASILPDESAEVAARRFAPENAYFPLSEALDAIPRLPANLAEPAKDVARVGNDYQPPPGSLGAIVGIRRTDDDPQLLSALQACEPTIAKIREALARPYFLLPVNWKESRSAKQGEDDLLFRGRRITHLGKFLTMSGLLALRAGDEEGALAGILDAFRLALLVETDGALYEGRRVGIPPYLNEFLQKASDSALKKALVEVRRMRSEVMPETNKVKFLLRRIGAGSVYVDPDAVKGSSPASFYAKMRVYWLLRELRSKTRIHQKELLAIIDLPFPAVRARYSQNHPAFHAAQAGKPSEQRSELTQIGGLFQQLLSDVVEMARSQTQVRSVLDGTSICCAIELYKRGEGAFPESLSPLAPKYMDAVPLDAFSEEPFVYKRVGSDFQLYSVGANGKDDGGAEIPEGRTRRRGDDFIYHWPNSGNG